jgi:release factor glutamine methyltransferase
MRVWQTPLDAVNTWLHSSLGQRLMGKVDVLLFNPPYVPTGEHEASDAQHAGDISGAWAGGADGMQVTDRLLPVVNVRTCIYITSRTLR